MSASAKKRQAMPDGEHAGDGAVKYLPSVAKTPSQIATDADHEGKRASRGGGLDGKKAQAIALMVRGAPVVEVAANVDVHRSTIHRWLAEPDFLRELSNRRDEFLDRTFDLQAYGSSLAATKLIELLDSQDERVALRAAQTLVVAERTYALIDQERRIRRLEDNLPFALVEAF
jgi:hypothetical protein